jgi:hypothetical protein
MVGYANTGGAAIDQSRLNATRVRLPTRSRSGGGSVR